MSFRDPSLEESGAPPEESAEEILENAPCGHLSLSLDGFILKVNQTFLKWTGYQADDLVEARRFQDILDPGSRIYYETFQAPLLRMQGAVQEIAATLVASDGRQLPVLVNSAIRIDETGKPLLIRVAVFIAIDRRRHERELMLAKSKAESSSKSKAAFVSMASHEIRTPINAIQGVAHLLEDTPLTDHQKELVQILRSSTDNLLKLINDVLDFSKIESSNVKLEERDFDLRQMIALSLRDLRRRALAKGVTLDVSVAPEVPQALIGDSVKIGQVLTNLTGNAVKFTQEGSVTVSVEVVESSRSEVSIEFRVRDTGIGIPEDRLPYIFDEFTQASAEIGDKFGGSGLGLAISKRLVELYGGKLVASSTLGIGSTFSFVVRFRLPELALSPRTDRRPVDRRRLRGLQVLVADDNEINVMVLCAFLEAWGVEFDVVRNGEEALRNVQAREYDAILMDLRMPVLDGYGATKAIRALPEGKNTRVPIIAVSASMGLEHQEDFQGAGFSAFISKPFEPAALFELIARLTSRQSAFR